MFEIKSVLALALVSMPISFTYAQALCFSSGEGSKKIRLQLNLPAERSKHASVVYQKTGKAIELLRTDESSMGELNGRPSITKTNFVELINGKKNGTYVLITQGAIVGELTYKNDRSNKEYVFYDDQEAYAGNDCAWSSKH